MTSRRRTPGLLRAAVPFTALALALTACSDGGSKASGADEKGGSSAEAGVISLKSAQAVLLNYAKANNAANAAQAPDRTAEVEGGALLQQSQATFTQFKALPKKEQASFRTPFHYPVEGARFYIPRKGSPQVFMVDTRVTGEDIEKDRRRLLVFEHVKDYEKSKNKGAEWKAVSVGEADGRLPAVKRDDDGFVTVLKASDPVGKVKLDDLRDLSKDFYVTGGKKAGASFVNTASVKAWKKSYANRAAFDDGCVDGEYEPGFTAAETAYGLKTTDGGALALYDFGIDYQNWPKAEGPRCATQLDIKDLPTVTDIYLDGRTSTSGLTRTNSLITMAVVPASGTDIRVTGYHLQMVNAK
ncbi:hypothetical protein GCM10010306_004850 [Streptomyces umbrinus]|uniref:hypothetical protein n=1 Tax=Streptomyces umbrinus TaxID=67370 RepID=UPI0016720683|nr:hypothetical protein [Streptomyces umbrinus]GHB16236.1 hypothetical protein GCM10010306_004850 [Streptomyces umbrinus]